MHIDHQVALKIVDRAMKIIDHNVNVINHQGVIIGSGDPKRINQLHEGALNVLCPGVKIDFNTDEAQTLPGVRVASISPSLMRGGSLVSSGLLENLIRSVNMPIWF